MNNAIALSELRRPDVLLASGVGVGFLPKAPGTWGSVWALLLWWPIASLAPALQILFIAGYFVVGWWCSHRICVRYGVDDASIIIADEIVGMWLALLFLPTVWWLWLIAFLMFRLLDIAKPGPIGWLDREVKGGLGVMLDDVLAGLVTGGVVYLSVLVVAAV